MVEDGMIDLVISSETAQALSLCAQDAHTLADAASRLSEAETPETLGEALAHNLEVWVAIKTLIGTGDGSVPVEIRRNLDRLAVFVIRTTLGAEEGRLTAGSIKTMAEINLAIADGLRMGQQNQLIRDRAYRLWEEDGRPEGRQLDHWVQAEREIMALLARG